MTTNHCFQVNAIKEADGDDGDESGGVLVSREWAIGLI